MVGAMDAGTAAGRGGATGVTIREGAVAAGALGGLIAGAAGLASWVGG